MAHEDRGLKVDDGPGSWRMVRGPGNEGFDFCFLVGSGLYLVCILSVRLDLACASRQLRSLPARVLEFQRPAGARGDDGPVTGHVMPG